MALACAPLIESMTCQLDLPTQNGRMDRSARYPNMRITCFMFRIFLSLSFAKECVKAVFLRTNMWITFLLFTIMKSPNYRDVIFIETIRSKCNHYHEVPGNRKLLLICNQHTQVMLQGTLRLPYGIRQELLSWNCVSMDRRSQIILELQKVYRMAALHRPAGRCP